MDELLAVGDRDSGVEALFRSVEEVSDEEMAALRSAPSWPGRLAAGHTVTREIVGEAQAGLDAEQAPKIYVPVLLVTGELQLFRLKVEPLASQGCSLQQWMDGAAVPCRAGVGDKRHLLPVSEVRVGVRRSIGGAVE
jgi:hypothetical protein